MLYIREAKDTPAFSRALLLMHAWLFSMGKFSHHHHIAIIIVSRTIITELFWPEKKKLLCYDYYWSAEMSKVYPKLKMIYVNTQGKYELGFLRRLGFCFADAKRFEYIYKSISDTHLLAIWNNHCHLNIFNWISVLGITLLGTSGNKRYEFIRNRFISEIHREREKRIVSGRRS